MGTVGIVGDKKKFESLDFFRVCIYVVNSKYGANGVEVQVTFMICGQRDHCG